MEIAEAVAFRMARHHYLLFKHETDHSTRKPIQKSNQFPEWELWPVEAEDPISHRSRLIRQPDTHESNSENPIPSAAIEEKSAIAFISKDPWKQSLHGDPPSLFYSVRQVLRISGAKSSLGCRIDVFLGGSKVWNSALRTDRLHQKIRLPLGNLIR
jgi:hypothetical protein